MRRLGAFVPLVLVVVLIIPVVAQGDGHEFDRHPHLLLQRPEIDLVDDAPHLVGYRKCVDLAANQTVPLHAHHEHLHFGTSGVSFGGASGHAVVPAAPFPQPFFPEVPWTDCASFNALLPIPLPPED